MKIKILDENEKRMTFILSDSNTAFANALRRIMTSEVPVMAVESVYFEKNSTGLYDEIIAHRIGLIPIKFNVKSYGMKSACSCKGKGCSKCQVVLSFDSSKLDVKIGEEFTTVKSGDMVSDDADVAPVSLNIPIVEILEGHDLKFDAIAILGIGKDHSKWQASNTGYMQMPSVKIAGQKCKSCKTCIESCPRGVFEEKAGKITVAHEDRCIMCLSCVDRCDEGAVSVKGDDTSFLFNVESVSGLEPKVILDRALEILEDKAKEFVKEVK